MNECEYCHIQFEQQKLVLENEHCLFLIANEPEIEGAGIIIPREHRETVFDLTEAEWAATYELLQKAKAYIEENYRPEGFNVGWNCGHVGGQHVFHSHLHVIPRYADEPYAGRGIRYWFKSKENRRS
ncbi:HIT family protein [Paenibacillus sp. HJGM_3]|uniref:HIT family protein n=1 Tax=Paenibacillus sp. HJGM_3 TaxID=3379816 RepID=UPI00385AC029